ncbi:hypothetical protein APICC_03009 [Apis cerana cerana]|uniref:Uncharacterized protein n=1 Tax=Apis cerana cerana TaxID=94128 RepID=A0A2A3EDG8_APICC|nr:hypothetical protein APICC_03009 [Apis cerana cerana]
MIGKFVTKLIQTIPTWEVTKYYGRVCIYQLKCLKYKIQTSEAWFNFKCKFMPGSLNNELECEEPIKTKVKNESQQQKGQNESSETKSQNQCKNHESATSLNDLKNTYVINELMPHTKKQEKDDKKIIKDNKKYQENEKYIHEEYATKKERKMKRVQ